MKTPTYPAPPDPAATAAAQTASNKETAVTNAVLNRVNQYGPQGSVTYTQTGTYGGGGAGDPGTERGGDGSASGAAGVPIYEQRTTLSPEYQKIFDNQTGLETKLGDFALSQGSKVGDLLSKPFDPNTEAENKIVALQRARLDPQWQQQEDAMRTQLINSGMRPGTEGYDREMQNFSQRKQDAYNSMYLQGRQQAVQEAQLQRSVPLNELMGVMSGTQIQNPNYTGVPQTAQANTDVAGIYQNNFSNQMQIANAQNSQQNAMMGGLFGLGGAAMKFMPWSDRRLKKDIVQVGTGRRGLPLYLFRYVWGGDVELGYMAQEVELVAPHAVGEQDGFKFVRLEEV